jgi:hypothetical protein
MQRDFREILPGDFKIDQYGSRLALREGRGPEGRKRVELKSTNLTIVRFVDFYSGRTSKCSATQELVAICGGTGGDEGRMRCTDAILLAVDEDDPPNSVLSVLTPISQVATAAATGGRMSIVTWCTKN